MVVEGTLLKFHVFGNPTPPANQLVLLSRSSTSAREIVGVIGQERVQVAMAYTLPAPPANFRKIDSEIPGPSTNGWRRRDTAQWHGSGGHILMRICLRLLGPLVGDGACGDRTSTRLNSSH